MQRTLNRHPNQRRAMPRLDMLRAQAFMRSVDDATVLTAAGLQGVIQSVRDATAATYLNLESAALPFAASLLLWLCVTAWRKGSAFREQAANARLTESDAGLLAICLAVDLVGDSSFILGEWSDIFWAPLSALLLTTLFDSPVLATVNLFKELLPLLDAVPWLMHF